MTSLVDIPSLEQQEPGDRPSNTSLIDAPIDKLPELVNQLEKASFFPNGQETPFPDTKALSATKSSGKVRFNESPASAFTPAEPPGKDPLGVGMVDDIPANSTFQGTTLNPNANLYAPTHHDYFAPRWSHVDVGRWNVKFNGRNSVTDFLERIEELRISREVSKERLFQSAAELFTHDALLWYRTAQVSSWDELCTQLKQMFQPYDYEYSLWDEIRRRTQGAQERVGNYIVVMENLFRKLPTPVSESTKLNLIMRNLLPSFQTQLALHPVNSVSQLMTLARSIEEAVQRAQKYQPPPTSALGLLEPELRYRRTEGFPQYANPLSAVPPSNSQSDVPSDLGENQSSRIPIVAAVNNASKCWNCVTDIIRMKFGSESSASNFVLDKDEINNIILGSETVFSKKTTKTKTPSREDKINRPEHNVQGNATKSDRSYNVGLDDMNTIFSPKMSISRIPPEVSHEVRYTKNTKKVEDTIADVGIEKGYEIEDFVREVIRLNSEIEEELNRNVVEKIKVIARKDCRNPRKENWILQPPPEIPKWFLKRGFVNFDLPKVCVQPSNLF
nr:unnamed protein product [Callosobruchus analis]